MAQAADFFVSYTSADRAWAEWIAWQLEAEGYTVVVQAWDFIPGRSWIHEMQQATSTAERVVAVLSVAYLESEHGESEWQVFQAKDPLGKHGLLLPVRVGEVDPPGLLKTRIYVDLVGRDAASARTALLVGARGARGKPTEEPEFPGTPTRPEGIRAPRFPDELPSVWNLPYRRNRMFTGRKEALAALAQQLERNTDNAVTQAIYGGAGIGKTAVAAEYAWRYRAEFDMVWWVRAEEPATLLEALAQLIPEVDLPEAAQANQKIAVGAVRHWLENHDRWLLILDNAQAPQATTGLKAPLERLADVLPRVVHGQVLVTSRDARWDEEAELVELDLFSPEEAVGFLLRRTRSGDRQAADEVAEQLGNLPLALEQAGAYVRETGISLADYLDRLRRFPARTLAKGRPRDRDPADTVATTWKVSLEQVGRVPGAVALLRACAFMAPDDIPRNLFTEHADGRPDELADLTADPLALDDAVAALRRYSLLRIIEDGLYIHRPLQLVVRAELEADAQSSWTARAIRLLDASFPADSKQVENWPECQRLLPHVLAAAKHGSLERRPTLQGRVGGYLWSRGHYQQALPLQKQALATHRRVKGENHPDTLQSMNDLAWTLRKLGDDQGAGQLFERALAGRQRELGNDHPDTLHSMNDLAMIRRALGDLQGARDLYQQALDARREKLGHDHPDTLWSMNGLAETRRALGDLQSADELFEQVLDARRRVLPNDNPEIFWSMNGLAETRRALGDLQGARQLHEQALAARRRVLGEDHPDTLTSINNLAETRRALGDLDGARQLHEQALSGRRRVLSDEHHDTLTSMNNLAAVRREIGEL